jgi:ketosteroid isomerase-like protein
MNKKVFYAFVEAINQHTTDGICSLMTNDHKFIDAQGNEITGKGKMKIAWQSYFELFPDYKIEVIDIFESADIIGAFGSASGSFKEAKNSHFLKLPAAWKAIIEKNKVKHWQVYADTKIPFDIISKNQSQQ